MCYGLNKTMVPEALLPLDDSTAQLDIDWLVADVEDVTEPSSIDKVLEYAEQIQEEDENFMQLLTEKLGDEEIYWELPWYQQDKKLTRRHNTEQDDEATSYRTDTISKDEHDLIAKNWRKLRKRYRLPDSIISLARWKNKTHTKNPKFSPVERARRFATAFLARGLRRNTNQVYRHILAYYGGQRKGSYNATERKIMEICYHHKPKTHRRITSIVLGREPRGIYKRFEYMVKGEPPKKRLKWNLTLASKFLQSLLTYSELKLKELKNRKIDKAVWLKLADDMEHNDIHLQHFWYCYLHVQLFVKCDVKLQELRKTILNKIRQKGRENVYKIWSDIRWKELALEFPDAYTPRFLYRVGTRLISEKGLKGYLKAPIEHVLEYAFEKIKNEKGMQRNKRLKTLKFNKEGQLEVVLYKRRDNALEGQ